MSSYKYIVTIFITVSCLLFCNAVFAASPQVAPSNNNLNSEINKGGSVELDDPLGMEEELREGTAINILIGKIINSVLGVVGSIALAMFVWYGVLWMTSAGNSERVQKGKDGLIWSVVGLIIIFSAYAMVKFVLDGLGVG